MNPHSRNLPNLLVEVFPPFSFRVDGVKTGIQWVTSRSTKREQYRVGLLLQKIVVLRTSDFALKAASLERVSYLEIPDH